tara:strand:+ start:1111 stop:2454 length:1344 start_codon:yes stop_codon:yes gene_type:complete
MVLDDDYLNKVSDLVNQKDFKNLKIKFKDIHPYDLSEIIQNLKIDQRNEILTVLPDKILIELIPELPEEIQLEFVEILSPRLAARLLTSIPPDEMTDVLGDLTIESRRKIVSYFSKEKSSEARNLLKYPDDTAGGLMTTEFVALPMETTVSETIKYIRENTKDFEAVYYVYVLSNKKLIGVLSLKNLVLAASSSQLGNIMNPDVIKVPFDMDQEEVSHIIADYDLLSVPVVDNAKKLLGIVTVDDVIDVIEEEVTEDIAHLAGTEVKINKMVDAPAHLVVRARLPWLIFALIGGLLAGSVIEFFNETLSSVVLLAIFIPVIMSMGGNVGIQSSTVFVRGIAIGEIKEPWKYFFREIKIGLLMGLLVGITIGLIAHFWKGMPSLGFIVGASMFSTIILATTIGIAIPKMFDKLGVDPAISASPFVTTIEDIMGLLIYFSIATYLFIVI